MARRIAKWGLALLGAAVCLATTRYETPGHACPVPVPVLVDLAVLGVVGLAIVIVESQKPSLIWARASWAVCGSLVALVFICVWSLAPWVLLGAVALGGVALLSQKLLSRQTLVGLGILVVAATVNFVPLFVLAKRSGVEVVDVPKDSFVAQAFPVVNYADAYRVSLPANAPQDIESVSRAVLAELLPCWSNQRSRDSLRAQLQQATFEPGRSLGGWTAYYKAANEIVVGADQPHLDFRFSIHVQEKDGARWVTVSTVVRYNNWQGRAYFVPVRIGHQIIIPHMVRVAVHYLP
ncbi:MAG: DUF2867 domain-containing protein [Acidobacteria bacterium]|nr:DUF2867 domain-containing protein [Acidobacteriota bacterium]